MADFSQGPPTQHKISTNNCRIERITESRLYKDPLNKGRRCVVLCEGFYEWKKPKSKGGIKQPYIIYFPQPEGVSTLLIIFNSDSDVNFSLFY